MTQAPRMDLSSLKDPLQDDPTAGEIAGIVFRRAVLSDAPVIHDLIRRAYAHYIPILGYAPGPMRRHYKIQLAENPVWLAVAGYELAALLELIIEPESVVVEDLAVAPEAPASGPGAMQPPRQLASSTRRSAAPSASPGRGPNSTQKEGNWATRKTPAPHGASG